MGRYAFSMWMGRESQGQDSGDQPFIGIDEKTKDPALMQPGYVRAAYNCRIQNGNLGTRGGITYASSFNPVDFGKIFGRGYFVDPLTGIQWLLLATGNGMWAVSDGQAPKFVNLPTGTVFTGFVDLIPCYGVVILFLGPNATPLYWDGNWAHSFTSLPNPAPGKTQIPDAVTGEFISDRIVIPYGVDSIAASDIGSYYSYNTFFNNFNINQGEGDPLVRAMEWSRGTALFFKSRSIYQALNFSGDLTQMILSRIARGMGLVGRRAAVLVGNDFFFMSSGAVYRMQQVAQDAPEAIALPISEPLIETMKRINWAAGSGIIAQWRKDRVYFAVPLDGATQNNALLVWNIVREAWESIDTFPNSPTLTLDDIVEMPYNGERRLFAIDYTNGDVYLMEDESSVDYIGGNVNSSTQIYTYILSRGLTGPGLFDNYRHLKLGLATWNPMFSVNVYSSGVGSKQNVATNVTKPTTKYYGFQIPDWVSTNVNNDWGDRDRKDYSVSLPMALNLNGVVLDQKQDVVERYAIRVPGKYAQVEVINTQGAIELRDIVFEAWEDQRGDKRAI